MTTPAGRPSAWEPLEAALLGHRPVTVSYHGHRRLVCPHALGWKEGRGRAMLLAYQAAARKLPLAGVLRH